MPITAYCDAGSRGNPGPAACAYVIYENGKKTLYSSWYSGEQTNNVAEYSALIGLLRELKVPAEIFCDSALVVNQVMGKWKVKHENMKPLHAEAQALLIRGKHTLTHIKGHSGIPGNELADQLVNIELNDYEEKSKERKA